jgi:ribosomal protein S7
VYKSTRSVVVVLPASAEPIETFKQALDNIGPAVEIKSRRVGGSTYQVPASMCAITPTLR